MKNWIEAMIERFRASTTEVNSRVFSLTMEKKIEIIKRVDFEAFLNLFLLAVDGIINVDLTKKRSVRDTPEYKNWRKKILGRDNYTCQCCGSKQNLEVHHNKSVRFYPELATNINNGITLCNSCHKKTNNYGHKTIINYE